MKKNKATKNQTRPGRCKRRVWKNKARQKSVAAEIGKTVGSF